MRSANAGIVNRRLRKLAKRLPSRWQLELKRWFYRRQILRGRFQTTEKEFLALDKMVHRGEWVLDVGANVGHYTARLSALVGPEGRVIAFEPIPQTFALLASNMPYFPYPNVTLLNVALSAEPGNLRMEIPVESDGTANYYQASITDDGTVGVLGITSDALELPRRIALVKIDAEGHELLVLRGMGRLLERDHPVLIVEDNDTSVREYLEKFGYTSERLPESHNLIFTAQDASGTKSSMAPSVITPPANNQ